MRFFTPELYVRFNSSDDDQADRADEAWEAAIRGYRAYLGSIADALPPRARGIAEELNLHDAELLGLRADVPGPARSPSPPVATPSLGQEEDSVNLNHLLGGPVARTPPDGPWPFATSPDGSSDAGYGHRVPPSDGRSIVIPFIGAIVNRFSPGRPGTALVRRVGV